MIQGDIFSPVVFIAGLAGIMDLALSNDHRAKLIQDGTLSIGDECYADDTALFAELSSEEVEGKTPAEIRNGLCKVASEKATLFATQAYAIAALEVKPSKTKAMIIEPQIKCTITEDDIHTASKGWKHACPDCGRKFKYRQSVYNHKNNHCMLQATTESWTIRKIVDACSCSNGRHYRVQWAGADEDGCAWPDTWEPALRLCDEDQTDGPPKDDNGSAATSVRDFWRSPPQAPPKGGDLCEPACPGGDWQCTHCPTWWPTAGSRDAHSRRCKHKPKQYGMGSLSAKALKRDLALAAQGAGCQDIKCNDDVIEMVDHFVYLGVDYANDGDSLVTVEHRLAIARSNFNSLLGLWKDTRLHYKLKLQLYRAAIVSTATYGCVAWRLDAQAKRRMNNFNSKNMAIITGKTIEEMAVAPPFNIINYIEHTRLQWLGTILNMDEGRDLHKAVMEIYEINETAGTLLEHAPDSPSFTHLVALAQSRRWNQHCKKFKFLE